MRMYTFTCQTCKKKFTVIYQQARNCKEITGYFPRNCPSCTKPNIFGFDDVILPEIKYIEEEDIEVLWKKIKYPNSTSIVFDSMGGYIEKPNINLFESFNINNQNTTRFDLNQVIWNMKLTVDIRDYEYNIKHFVC